MVLGADSWIEDLLDCLLVGGLLALSGKTQSFHLRALLGVIEARVDPSSWSLGMTLELTSSSDALLRLPADGAYLMKPYGLSWVSFRLAMLLISPYSRWRHLGFRWVVFT